MKHFKRIYLHEVRWKITNFCLDLLTTSISISRNSASTHTVSWFHPGITASVRKRWDLTGPSPNRNLRWYCLLCAFSPSETTEFSKRRASQHLKESLKTCRINMQIWLSIDCYFPMHEKSLRLCDYLGKTHEAIDLSSEAAGLWW